MRELKYAVISPIVHLVSFIFAISINAGGVPRQPPVGPGINCSSVATYADGIANVTILGPTGRVLGRNTTIHLPKKGWSNLESALPYPLALKKQKKNLLFRYSNDQSWTALYDTPTNSPFDCREFKFWLHTNFWQFSIGKTVGVGTLNWTMVTLDGTKLGGAPQTDIVASKKGFTPLKSLLDKTVDVHWNKYNNMTFKYGDQTVILPNATGSHSTELIGSAPVNVFSWATSGVL